jgi:hypothetical protein
MTVGLVAAGLLTTGCTPQNTADKLVSGTIMGSDGNVVDALIGFDVRDGAGNMIDLGAKKVGYSAIQRLNYCVPTTGAAATQTCPNGYVTGKTWSIKVPYNAAKIYIEVYPKAPSSTNYLNTPTYSGPMAGTTNTSTYSATYRRDISLPGSVSNVKVVLPLTCGVPGGQTGSLYGHIAGWPIGHTGTANAWSMASNTLATQGFGLGLVDTNGNYRINGLMAGQRYGIIAGTAGFSRNEVTYANSQGDKTLVPSACYQKQYDF